MKFTKAELKEELKRELLAELQNLRAQIRHHSDVNVVNMEDVITHDIGSDNRSFQIEGQGMAAGGKIIKPEATPINNLFANL